MNILQLKYVIEVEKTGSISKAAKNLYMSQSRLSKAIKELEESMGIAIFKRTSKGAVPTGKGGEFIASAKGILSRFERLEMIYNPLKNGIVSLEASVPRASYISEVFSEYIAENNDFEKFKISYRETNTKKVIKNVAVGESNIGVVRYLAEQEPYLIKILDDKEIKHEDLWEFERMLVFSENSPLALKEIITAEDLVKLTEVDFGDNAAPYIDNAKTHEYKDAVDGKKRIFLYDRASMYDVLQHDRCAYAFISPPSAHFYERFSLNVRPLSGKSPLFRDAFIWRREYHLTATDRRFAQMLKEKIKEIITEKKGVSYALY